MKAAIFDLDGTLLDSTGVWKKIDVDFLKKRGLEVPEDYGATIVTMTFYETAVYTAERFGFDDTPESIMAEWRDMAISEYSGNVRLKPNAREYLDRLKGTGVRLGVATAATPELYTPALKNNGIYEMFDTICSADEIGKGKNSPDIFLVTAKRLGAAPEECVVFEDALQAVYSAKAAGMRVYGVYDICAAEQREKIEAAADGYITDFADAPIK